MIVVTRSPKDIDPERRIARLRLEGPAARCSMNERQAQLIVMTKRAQRRRVVVGAISMLVEVSERPG